jgi:Glu-tRNA(Gln) amidotransferase subunit E-like FAD-binding protein
MTDQDRHLDELSKSVQRQQEISHLISTELEQQVHLLETMETTTDRQRVNVKRNYWDWMDIQKDHLYQNGKYSISTTENVCN